MYGANRLQSVICKVDFARDIPQFMDEPSLEMLNLIKPLFPIMEQKKGKQFQFQISDKEAGSSELKDFTHCIFHNESREKSLSINPDSIFIQYKKFTSFSQTSSEFVEIVKKIFEDSPDETVKRIGLRYTNIFTKKDFTKKALSNYINKDYIFKNLTSEDVLNTSRRIIVFDYNNNDKTKTRLQYGYYNPEYPAQIKNWNFIIDCDSYTDYMLSISEFDTLANKLHANACILFEDIITETTRDLLKE